MTSRTVQHDAALAVLAEAKQAEQQSARQLAAALEALKSHGQTSQPFGPNPKHSKRY